MPARRHQEMEPTGAENHATARPRKRGRACERCNKRRTRCDSSVIGTPCTECKNSGNEAICVLVESKRRRGPDGRYTTHGHTRKDMGRGRHRIGADTGIVTPNQPSSSPPSGSNRPGSTQTRTPTATSTHDSGNETQGSVSAPPNYVGESWYASYVMRGYKPGHASFHKPLDGSNEMVQSISRDIQRPHGQHAPSPGRSASHGPQREASLPTAEPGLSEQVPSPDLIERLVKAYFTRFHTYCPILIQSSFEASLAGGTLSKTLLLCVLFVGSIHCGMETIYLLGYSSRVQANSALSARAVAAFDADRTTDRTNMFLSSFLLHYWFGDPTAHRDWHWWLACSIRSAQCMGYHRSTKYSPMPPEEKARWKRIWWCLYVRDRQTSLSTGTPMIINDADHDVEELVPEDLAGENPETIFYIIGQVGLSKTAAHLYFLHCSPRCLTLSQDSSVRERALEDVRLTLRAWFDSQAFLVGPAGGHYLSLTLKVCYNYYIINLSQRLQRQAPKTQTNRSSMAQIIDAASAVFTLVDDSLLYWSPEHFPLIYISALFSAMVALAVDAAPTMRPDGEQLLHPIRRGLLALKQFENNWTLARWIKNFFMNCLVQRDRADRVSGFASRDDSDAGTPRAGSEEVTDGHETHSHAQMQPGRAFSDQAPDAVRQGPPEMVLPSGLAAVANFMFDHDGGFHGDLPREETAGSWPLYSLPEGSNTMECIGFPMPDSSHYQALYFLADLGMAGTE